MEKETYLTFLLEQELFAVNVINVLEVIEQQQVTRVPKAPTHILGIINFRGEILPVIDTRQKFNLPVQEAQIKNFIIVYDISIDNQHYTVAATADGVKDVIELSLSDIKPIPEMGLSFDSRYMIGAIRQDEHFILLLHPQKVFTITDTDTLLQPELINQ